MPRRTFTGPLVALSVGVGLLAGAAPAAASRPAPLVPPGWTIYGDVIVEVKSQEVRTLGAAAPRRR
jgi:hypothetical protein